jgi:hypothetical protein
LQFASLGKGYEAWCTGAEEALKSARKIAKVRENLARVMGYDDVTMVQRYCDSTWTGKKMILGEDGPCLPITMVASDVYPVETADIKKDCLGQPATAHPSYSSATPHPSYGTLTIQHPGEVGQEAEAMKGAAKLMLLCLRGKVDITSASITNIALAVKGRSSVDEWAQRQNFRVQGHEASSSRRRLAAL